MDGRKEREELSCKQKLAREEALRGGERRKELESNFACSVCRRGKEEVTWGEGRGKRGAEAARCESRDGLKCFSSFSFSSFSLWPDGATKIVFGIPGVIGETGEIPGLRCWLG